MLRHQGMPERFFRQARQLLDSLRVTAQQMPTDAEISSPNIVIEPVEGAVQKAVDLLRGIDPNYFVGVRKIVVSPSGGAYGMVESGDGKDPSVIHLNLNRIRSELQGRLGGDPQALEKELVRQLASTISHERGHVKSFHPQQGFVGGESPAESEASRLKPQIDLKAR